MKSASRDALLLIFAGVVFRIWTVGNARFTGDESYFWATARNIATFDAAPVFGPALTGSGAYHPGPIFYYLQALPQFFGSSPWLGGIFVVLLHAFASWLAFGLASRLGGPRAGLVLLAWLAFAPWDVLYGDRIWLSCVAPVFGTLVLVAATRLDSRLWQAVLVFGAVVLPQLHMSAPVVWAAVLVLIFLGPKPVWNVRALAAGLALAVLCYLPPLYWELTHDFANTRAILSEGGGKEPWEKVVQTPLKVFGYALFYATSEIGYHFGTGYWRPFDDLTRYGTLEGWRSWWSLHGPLWGTASAVSLGLALVAWFGALAALLRAIKGAVAVRTARALGPEGALTLALLVALIAATALMMVSKKPYFPHYTNLLMPVILVPLALAVDRLLTRAGLVRAATSLALAISMAAMASSSIRYYLQVDRLNGLSATLSMTEEVMAGPMPVELHFSGFHNRFAWEMLANVKYRRPLKVSGGAPVKWRVHNGGPFTGPELPPGSTLHGAVRLERIPPLEGR